MKMTTYLRALVLAHGKVSIGDAIINYEAEIKDQKGEPLTDLSGMDDCMARYRRQQAKFYNKVASVLATLNAPEVEQAANMAQIDKGGSEMKTVHRLKVWPEFFDDLATGVKTFELRDKRDRDFKVDDTLVLGEWSPMSQIYSGREVHKRITYILEGWGLKDGYVCMGLADLP